MGRLAGADETEGSSSPDIMQIARVGDVAAMEALFEDGDYDATYTDDEGITPLHVSDQPTLFLLHLPSRAG